MKHALLIFVLSVSFAFAADPPECLLEFVSDYKLQMSAGGGVMDIKRKEQFVGRIYPSEAKIKIDRLWYTVPRNAVMVRSWTVPTAGEG
jgi:hypothetical protein